jgi:hypothetical protein
MHHGHRKASGDYAAIHAFWITVFLLCSTTPLYLPHSSPAGCAFTFYAVVLTLLEWVQECILALAS